jgi:hypothetical protein
MKLAIFNGSPRGKESNTGTLLEYFLNGFVETQGNTYELAYLIRVRERNKFVEMFRQAEQVLLAFPLSNDAMPSVVKEFIESLEPLRKQADNPAIGFVVQSGLPESIHSRFVERYLEKLAVRLGCRYQGTVIRGGVEAIRIPPLLDKKIHKWICEIGKATDFAGVGHLIDDEKLFRTFYELGKTFGRVGEFDRKMVKELAQLEKLTRFGFWVFKTVVHNLYFNLLLKKNNAFSKKSDRPYVQ